MTQPCPTMTDTFDSMRVAAPCSADWSAMAGDDRRRFCAQCERNVYNLSGMSRSAAERLVAQAEGRLCVRFFRRADGTVLTADCPVGLRHRARRAFARTTALLGMVLCGAFSCRRQPVEPAGAGDPTPGQLVAPVPPDAELVMGEVCAPEVHAPATRAPQDGAR